MNRERLDARAIIPAHAAGTELLTPLAGSTPLARAVDAAKRAGCLDLTVITLDHAVAASATALGAQVVRGGPDALAPLLTSSPTNTSSTAILVLDPAQPGRADADIQDALALLATPGTSRVVSTFAARTDGVARADAAPDTNAILRRHNGSILALAPALAPALAAPHSSPSHAGATLELPMPAAAALRVDAPEERIALEAILRTRALHDAAALFQGLQLLVFDFDGVMSDNAVLVMQDGTEGVLCNRSDGLGLGMLKAAGVPALVLSKERNPVVSARCRKLDLECHQGVDDKAPALAALLSARGINPAHVAYVGNDLNDEACMRLVGLPIAVADAFEPALMAARYVTRAKGGLGAVREVIELTLAARQPRNARHA